MAATPLRRHAKVIRMVVSTNQAASRAGAAAMEELVQQTCENDKDVQVTATCIRVSVMRAHAVSVNLQFGKPLDEDTARHILKGAAGLVVIDTEIPNHFPTPLDVSSKDDVTVGCILQDLSIDGNLGQYVPCTAIYHFTYLKQNIASPFDINNAYHACTHLKSQQVGFVGLWRSDSQGCGSKCYPDRGEVNVEVFVHLA